MRFLLLACLLVLVSPPARAEDKPAAGRAEEVIYGRKFGMALTMDVFRPEKPNGAGILVVVSGGWVSDHNAIDAFLKPWIHYLLGRGYTVFAVCHGAQPKFAVPEILEDMNRAVRYIRHHAARYGVDPNRLGATGASAGGHLSLMLGTVAAEGKANARDPIDREKTGVQCVACFVPPTDFLNYGKPGEDAVGVGRLEAFRPAFGLKTGDAAERQKRGKEISPIYFVSRSTAPTFIVHGEKDELVPAQQAELFVQRCQALQVPAKLLVREGKGHGWNFMEDLPAIADWFDQHLGARKP